MKNKFTLQFEQDQITILYDGIESIMWHKDEWVENPDVVMSIANAIYLSQRSPKVLLEAGVCHHETVKQINKQYEK